MRIPVLTFASALILPTVIIAGCSTLFQGDVTQRLLELDEEVSDKVLEWKKGYCRLEPHHKDDFERIANRPKDPEKVTFTCPQSVQI